MYNEHLTPHDLGMGHYPFIANGGKYLNILGFANSHKGMGRRNIVGVSVLINNMPVKIAVVNKAIAPFREVLT